MILAINFDGAFERNTMVVATILLVIVGVRLYWLRPKKDEFAGMEGEKLIDEWVGRRHQKDPFDDSVLSDSIHDESMCRTPGDTEIVPGARKPIEEQASCADEPDAPFLRRLRQRPAQPSPEPEEKTAERTRSRLKQETIDGFTPTNDEEELLYPDLKKLARGGEVVRINVAEAIDGISLKAKRTLRDLLALSGEYDPLAALLALDPTLKEADFCERMEAMYTHLLDDLKDVRARDTKIFWQRCRDLVS